jgi:hypothetical protein
MKKVGKLEGLKVRKFKTISAISFQHCRAGFFSGFQTFQLLNFPTAIGKKYG